MSHFVAPPATPICVSIFYSIEVLQYWFTLTAWKGLEKHFCLLSLPRILSLSPMHRLYMHRTISTRQQTLLYKKTGFKRSTAGEWSNLKTLVDAKFFNTLSVKLLEEIRNESKSVWETPKRSQNGFCDDSSDSHCGLLWFKSARHNEKFQVSLLRLLFVCLLMLACFRQTGTVDKRRRLQTRSFFFSPLVENS